MVNPTASNWLPASGRSLLREDRHAKALGVDRDEFTSQLDFGLIRRDGDAQPIIEADEIKCSALIKAADEG